MSTKVLNTIQFLLIFFIPILLFCNNLEGLDISSKRNAIVYGEDTRQEAVLCDDSLYREIAFKSVISIVPKSAITIDKYQVSYFAPTLEEDKNMCSDERFIEQPVLAECSGVLVDEDLVLTAGHCIKDAKDCLDKYYLLGYAIDNQGAINFDSRDVYRCKELISREWSNVDEDARYDYALLRLDRPVNENGKPVLVRGGHVNPDERLVIIGNGLGLPTKIDLDGKVLLPGSSNSDYFLMRGDLFERGSGSPLFDEKGYLVGIGVRGGVDFDIVDDCMTIRTEPEDTNKFEEASYAGEALIRSGFPELIDLPFDDMSYEIDSNAYKDVDSGCTISSVGTSYDVSFFDFFIRIWLK